LLYHITNPLSPYIMQTRLPQYFLDHLDEDAAARFCKCQQLITSQQGIIYLKTSMYLNFVWKVWQCRQRCWGLMHIDSGKVYGPCVLHRYNSEGCEWAGRSHST
jgi:hypothetical protein